MDLDKIRKMNDEELEIYLKTLSDRLNSTCGKCGKGKGNYVINIKSKREKQQKKLCSICDNCYSDLLDYLGVSDILWD